MKLFPESAIFQLEFDKIKALLAAHCSGEFAKEKADNLRIHTKKEFIEPQLLQSQEYKQLLQNQLYFSNDSVFNLSKEIKLLGIEGAVLNGDQLLQIKKLCETIGQILDGSMQKEYPPILLWHWLSAKLILKNPSLR